MPTLRDVTVHVTDSNKVKLHEWGIQTLRGHNKVSSYIKSETDMSFQVMVQPKIPYIASDAASAHDYATRMRGTDRPGFFTMEDEWEDIDEDYEAPGMGDRNRGTSSRSKSTEYWRHQRSGSDRDGQRQHDQGQSSDDHKRLSSPIRPRDPHRTPPPPFHFLASLFLDGRDKPERKAVVYLDPDDVDYNHPDGKVQMKTRWVEGNDGTLKEHAWVFKDVGIETTFDKMLLSGDRQVSGTVNKRDEDAIIAAMESTELKADGDIKREEKCQVGQIVVKIQRVKLGEKWDDKNFRAKFKEGDIKDVNMDGANADITHTAGFTRGKSLGSQPVRVVAYTLFKEEEGPYATFQFFYRSQENLERFNFAGFPRTSRVLRSRRRLDSTMADMTPLSIARLLPSTASSSSKRRTSTFEEQVKQKTPNKTRTPRYGFGDTYRDNGPVMKKEESVSPTKSQLLSLPSLDPTAGVNIETSPGSAIGGNPTTGSDSSLFRSGPHQSRYILRSASKENVPDLPHQASAFASPQAPKPSIPGLFTSPDLSQSSTTSTLKETDVEATQTNNDPPPAYRKSIFSSDADADADDEKSDSDLEPHAGSDNEDIDIDFFAYVNQGNDDRLGLHLELSKVAIGEKRSRSPEDDDYEATYDNVLVDKSSWVKNNERLDTQPPRQLEDPRFEEQRREMAMAQLERIDENRNPMGGPPGQMKTPSKRVKFSDGEVEEAANKSRSVLDRLEFERALEDANNKKRVGSIRDL